MKLQIHNDGKGKFCGYGRDPAEALEELKTKVANRITELQAIDFTQAPVNVAWNGDPI